MASYISNLVHYVWGTESRRPVIKEDWKDRLYGYFGGILRNKKAKLISVGGMPDHVHVYASLPATVSISQIASALKSNSSRWVHENIPRADKFGWQDGYGAFSVSKSAEPTLLRYIANQVEHHRKREFKEELIALLEKHEIDYEDRYLWV